MSETSTNTLLCPKCQATMRSYERSGVTIDQCTECRGVFFDRGELERLFEAESSHYSAPRDDSRSDYQNDRSDYDGKHGKKRKRGGFLSDLFEGAGD